MCSTAVKLVRGKVTTVTCWRISLYNETSPMPGGGHGGLGGSGGGNAVGKPHSLFIAMMKSRSTGLCSTAGSTWRRGNVTCSPPRCWIRRCWVQRGKSELMMRTGVAQSLEGGGDDVWQQKRGRALGDHGPLLRRQSPCASRWMASMRSARGMSVMMRHPSEKLCTP